MDRDDEDGSAGVKETSLQHGILKAARYVVSGSFSGGAAYFVVTYILDFVDVFGSGEKFLRPIWSNGLAGWVSGIWDFGAPLGLSATAVISILQMF